MQQSIIIGLFRVGVYGILIWVETSSFALNLAEQSSEISRHSVNCAKVQVSKSVVDAIEQKYTT